MEEYSFSKIIYFSFKKIPLSVSTFERLPLAVSSHLATYHVYQESKYELNHRTSNSICSVGKLHSCVHHSKDFAKLFKRLAQVQSAINCGMLLPLFFFFFFIVRGSNPLFMHVKCFTRDESRATRFCNVGTPYFRHRTTYIGSSLFRW